MPTPTNIQRYVGKRPLIGATSQADTTPIDIQLVWKNTAGQVINLHGSAIMSSATLKHDAEIKRLKDNKGARCTVTSSDETLTMDVVAVPVGSEDVDTAFNNAIAAATLPAALSFVTIGHGPDIAFGPYIKGVNGTGNLASADQAGNIGTVALGGAINGNNWLYEGGGTLEIASDGEWGLKVTLVRSQNIGYMVAFEI